ncbi:phage holin family protein [Mariniluteicoccus flavus]
MSEQYEPGRAYERQVEGDNRSIGEVMGDITKDVSTLMRQEVALAKAEVAQSAKKAGTGAGMLGGAGVAGHFALLFLSLALWWALAHLMNGDRPMFGWAAVIVAVLWGIVAAILASMGKSKLNQVEGAPRTADSVSKIPNALKGEEAKNS